MPIKHFYNQTVADGTATSVVRPSDWNSNHSMVYNLSGNTLGSSQVAGSDVIFVGGNNITLSADTAASKMVISGPNTTPDATLGYLFLPQDGQITNLSAHANGTMSIQNRLVEQNRSATKLVIPVNISSVATALNASSAGINFSISFAIYTENANTLNTVSSTSFTQGATWSSNSTGSVTGGVFLTTPFNMSMSAGEYYFGVNMSTAATGGVLTGAATTSLANTISIVGMNTAQFGAFSWHDLGAGTTQSTGWGEQGLYTGTTAFTGPIAISNLSMAGTAAQRANFAAQLLI